MAELGQAVAEKAMNGLEATAGHPTLSFSRRSPLCARA